MNFFGITFLTSDMWLLGVCGVLMAWWLGPRIALHIKSHNASRSAYRHAFDDVVLNITENPTCTLAMIANSCHNGIIAAISNYRPHVPFWRRKAFERAVANYKDANNIATDFGSVYAIALSENSDVARAKRKHYHDAIRNLLSFS